MSEPRGLDPENLDVNLRYWGPGDRQDPIAEALRRFVSRIDCCPCNARFLRPCLECRLDALTIQRAWGASAALLHPAEGGAS